MFAYSARTGIKRTVAFTSDLVHLFGGLKGIVLVLAIAAGAKTYRSHGAPQLSVNGVRDWIQSLTRW